MRTTSESTLQQFSMNYDLACALQHLHQLRQHVFISFNHKTMSNACPSCLLHHGKRERERARARARARERERKREREREREREKERGKESWRLIDVAFIT